MLGGGGVVSRGLLFYTNRRLGKSEWTIRDFPFKTEGGKILMGFGLFLWMDVYPKTASLRRCGLVAEQQPIPRVGNPFSWWPFGSRALKGLGLSFTNGLSARLLFHGDTTFLSLEEATATKIRGLKSTHGRVIFWADHKNTPFRHNSWLSSSGVTLKI